MRFVIAIVLFVAAFVALGLGIAERTILRGPDSFTTHISTDKAPVTVIDSAALRAFPGTQKVSVSGSKDVFLAYGRSSDVIAWIGDASYNVVGFDAKKQHLTTKLTKGKDDTVPDAKGSDLWLQEYTGSSELTRRINAPSGISVIVLSNGKDAAPKNVTITWPLDNSAPLSGPLIIGGIFALLLGLGAFLWALVHARRRRGPRRKPPRLPKTPPQPRLKRGKQPKQLTTGPGALEDGAGTAPAATSRGRGRRTKAIAASALVAVSLALAGCTTGAAGGVTPTPTGSATAAPQKPAVVTQQQLAHILHKVVATVKDADKAGDPTKAATRLDGPALDMRVANYTVVKADPSLAVVPPIPDGTLKIVLPQQNDGWPRSVLAVVQPAEATAAPVAMVLVQDSARDNYKVHYVVTLEPDVKFPGVAPVQVGAAALKPDNAFGALPPNKLAESYGDILLNDKASASADLFDPDGDTLRTTIGKAYKDDKKANLPPTATIIFSQTVPDEPPQSFSTNDSGQLAVVSIDDIETVKPVEAGAAVNTSGEVKALSGHASSVKGIEATYNLQMLFYVPPVSEKGAKIKLLGFTSGLVNAVEIP